MEPNVSDKERDEQARAERVELAARLDKLIERAQASQTRHPQSYMRLQVPPSTKAKSWPDLQAAGEGWSQPEAEPAGSGLFDLMLVGALALLALRWLLGRRRV
jgi:hypothetical protein